MVPLRDQDNPGPRGHCPGVKNALLKRRHSANESRGTGPPESGSLLHPGYAGHGEDCPRSSRPMRTVTFNLAAEDHEWDVSARGPKCRRRPLSTVRVQFSQIVFESKDPDTCPRMAAISAPSTGCKVVQPANAVRRGEARRVYPVEIAQDMAEPTRSGILNEDGVADGI